MEKKNIAIVSGMVLSLIAIITFSNILAGDMPATIEQNKLLDLDKHYIIDPAQIMGQLSEKEGEDSIVVIIEFEEKSGVIFKKEVNNKNIDAVSKSNQLIDHKQIIQEEQDSTANSIRNGLGYDIKVKDKWNHVMNGVSATIKRKDLDKLREIPGVKNAWEETTQWPVD